MKTIKLIGAGAIMFMAFAVTPAMSAESGVTIKLDDPRWEKLSKAEQDAMIKDLTAGGVLGKNDKIVYVPPKKSGPDETNTGGVTPLLSLLSVICRKKTNSTLEGCADLSGAAATKCRDETKANAKKTKGICGG